MARKSRKNIVVTNEPEIKTAIYIRTAQYIRLSVEDSGNKGNSIENQKLILDDFIAQHPNMQCAGVYIDNGITGTTFNRPEFQRLTADIEAGKIDCVVVKDLSRLGRNSIDTGFYIERYFPEHNVRFIAVTDNFDSDEPKTNDGLMLYLKNIINEAYALDISKNIKTQRKQAMREGQYVAARSIYGYIKDPNDKHKLIVNPDTASIVKMIFESYVGGDSKRSICNRLIDSGIPSPSSYNYKGMLNNTVSTA
ncbi:MAG: recombinase family protein, partial [Firmicutes bacterium]|nr:recombinase family protein [Bacillota bacterium]